MQQLANAGIEDAGADLRLALESVLRLSWTDIFLNDPPLAEPQEAALQRIIERRLRHEPIQYILKSCTFLGLSLFVNEHVLIPRFDTERLVEAALDRLTDGEALLDMCTGSGIIALSLKRARPGLCVTACDISEDALSVAKKNAAANGLSVEWLQSDMFEALKGRRFDMICANPPYIKRADLALLSEEVKKEPSLALDGGSDGLFFYRIIAQKAKAHLKLGGRLALEIGHDQADSVAALLEKDFTDFALIRDFGQHPRVICAQLKGEENDTRHI